MHSSLRDYLLFRDSHFPKVIPFALYGGPTCSYGFGYGQEKYDLV